MARLHSMQVHTKSTHAHTHARTRRDINIKKTILKNFV